MEKIKDSKFKIQVLVIFLLLNILLPAASFAETVDEVVDRVQKAFAEIKDIKGDFVQTSFIKDLEQTQKYEGSFIMKKPSRMMWEYKSPRDEKVVVKDTEAWVYKKSENQVIKTGFSKESYSSAPMTIMENFENIRKEFDISMPEKNALNLIPKHKMGFVRMMVMETSTEGFPLKMFTIIDTYGNIIMIELDNIMVNPGLDDALFIFTVPAGAEVFDMNK